MREICLLLLLLFFSFSFLGIFSSDVVDCGNIMVAGYNTNLSLYGVNQKESKLEMCQSLRKEIDFY